MFYLAFGASIFSAIESPYEKQEIQRLSDKKAKFLQQHPCITGQAANQGDQIGRIFALWAIFFLWVVLKRITKVAQIFGLFFSTAEGYVSILTYVS
jgi:hypothetical protein